MPRDSIIIKEKTQFAISLLKNRLKQIIVSLISEEENLVASQP